MPSERTDPAPSTQDFRAGQSAPQYPTSANPETMGATPGTFQDAPSAPPIPPQFGEFDLLHVAGEGGMGIVYQARQRSNGRIVALKVMRQRAAGTLESVERFRREVRIGDLLRHPHIAAAVEAGEADGRLYYTMTYAPTNLWRQRQRFSDPRRAVRLTVQVARAVHFAHSLGVIHRDLKPSNILLTAADEPLVADFGLARWVDASQDLTDTGALLGTTGYMAPEQAAGATDQLTGAVDVWALGVMLYELLSGQRPFEGDGADPVLHQIRFAEPPPPRQFRPDLDPDLETIVMRCLRKAPSERYPTTAALADALERWLAGLPTREPKSLPSGRLRARSNRKLTAVVALVGLAAIIALIVYGAIGPGSPANSDAGRSDGEITNVVNSPERQQAIQNQIAKGQPVELVAIRGQPWHQRLNGKIQDLPFRFVKEGRGWEASSSEAGMLALVTSVPVASYSIEARIRHTAIEQGRGDARIGLFFGEVNVPAQRGELHCLYRFTLNDREDDAANIAARPKPAQFPAMPDGNLVSIDAVIYDMFWREAPAESLRTHDWNDRFEPAVRQPGKAVWRTLRIDVTLNDVVVHLDGRLVGRATRAEIDRTLTRLAGMAGDEPKQPIQFQPSGKLGIFVQRSTAVIDSFVITPRTTE